MQKHNNYFKCICVVLLLMQKKASPSGAKVFKNHAQNTGDPHTYLVNFIRLFLYCKQN